MIVETKHDERTSHNIVHHVDCGVDGNCPICDGGLVVCDTCKGAEGSLPSKCPGHAMTENQEAAVQTGRLDYTERGWVSLNPTTKTVEEADAS